MNNGYNTTFWQKSDGSIPHLSIEIYWLIIFEIKNMKISICSRAIYALLKINRVEHMLNKSTSPIAVTSLALSHLNYWSLWSKNTLIKAGVKILPSK